MSLSHFVDSLVDVLLVYDLVHSFQVTSEWFIDL